MNLKPTFNKRLLLCNTVKATIHLFKEPPNTNWLYFILHSPFDGMGRNDGIYSLRYYLQGMWLSHHFLGVVTF